VQHLRETLGLTGTNIDVTRVLWRLHRAAERESVKSCTFAREADGGHHDIEGLAGPTGPCTRCRAFRQKPCPPIGYCTPDVMAAVSLLDEEDTLDEHGVREARSQSLPLHRLPQHLQSMLSCALNAAWSPGRFVIPASFDYVRAGSWTRPSRCSRSTVTKPNVGRGPFVVATDEASPGHPRVLIDVEECGFVLHRGPGDEIAIGALPSPRSRNVIVVKDQVRCSPNGAPGGRSQVHIVHLGGTLATVTRHRIARSLLAWAARSCPRTKRAS